EGEHLAPRAHGGEVLALAEDHPGDAHLPAAHERLAQQRVGALGAAHRLEEVRAIVEDGIDLRLLDELHDVDRALEADVDRLEVLVGDLHVATAGVLVTLDDLLPGYLLAVDL